MDEKKSLTIVDQKTVVFYDDELIAVRATDSQVYVSIRHLCESIGVSRQGQIRRIKEHHVLAKGYAGGNIMLPPGRTGGGGRQQAALLRVDMVPLWLAGIDTKRVREEIRSKLERYQEEVAKVLWEAFQEGRLTSDPIFDELLEQDSPEVQAYKLIQGMLQLARNQILIKSRLDNHEQRLESIEATLSNPERYISREQASRISQAVRAIGLVTSERSGRNEYGAVYGELYRNFEISAYRELPSQKYEEAMKWLNAWYQRLTNQDIPF